MPFPILAAIVSAVKGAAATGAAGAAGAAASAAPAAAAGAAGAAAPAAAAGAAGAAGAAAPAAAMGAVGATTPAAAGSLVEGAMGAFSRGGTRGLLGYGVEKGLGRLGVPQGAAQGVGQMVGGDALGGSMRALGFGPGSIEGGGPGGGAAPMAEEAKLKALGKYLRNPNAGKGQEMLDAGQALPATPLPLRRQITVRDIRARIR